MLDEITVLIPTYNREEYILQCLDSIKKQTHEKLQIIIYDDGSTDNTVSLASTYKDIKVIEAPHNGVSFARNRLMELCATRYAAWQDSDDISNIHRIAEQYKIMKETSSAIVFCNWAFFKGSLNYNINELPDTDLMNNDKCFGGCMMDMESVGNIFFNEDITMGGEDFVWLKEAEKYNTQIHHKILYYVRRHDKRISTLKIRAENRAARLLSDLAYADAMKKLNPL